MTDIDSETAGTSNAAHYLDDGDTFTHGYISTLSDLTNYSGYDQIYLIGHGDHAGSIGVSSVTYTTAEIYSAYENVVNVAGCTFGTVDIDQVFITQWMTPTQNFLHE